MPPRQPNDKNLSIYEQDSYKAYLTALIATYPNGGRGLRKQLAEAIRCQVAYVSHVLAGDYHFSLEQAEAASRFFALPKEEAEYFLLLVSANRAGTPDLRDFYTRVMAEKKEQHNLLKSRAKIDSSLDPMDHATYYSHWFYAAIHMLLGVPGFRTRDAIAGKLRLPPRKVLEVLSFLTAKGLAKKEGSQYLPMGSLLHLPKDSPLISRHHANWRARASESLAEDRPHDLHYSAVVTCSEKDLPRVRERIAQCLEDCVEIIKPSKEEKLVGICLDWFEV